MVALFVVGHLFLLLVVFHVLLRSRCYAPRAVLRSASAGRQVLLLLVAFHVLLRSRRYAPRVVLRYASAGRGWAAETPVLRESGRGHEYCGDHNSEDSELHISLHCLPEDTA